MLDANALDALQRASSLELYHLSTVLDRLLADPKRILQISRHLHLGQQVRYLDMKAAGTELRLRPGTIVALEPFKAVVQDNATRERWSLPYPALEPSATAAAAQEPSPVMSRRRGREDFRKGERVSFEDQYLHTRVGVIVRINPKTATLDCDDGTQWRVSFGALRPLIDVTPLG